VRAASGVRRAPLRRALPRGRVRGEVRAAGRAHVPLRRAVQDAAVRSEAAVRAQVPTPARLHAPRMQAALLRRRLRAVQRGAMSLTSPSPPFVRLPRRSSTPNPNLKLKRQPGPRCAIASSCAARTNAPHRATTGRACPAHVPWWWRVRAAPPAPSIRVDETATPARHRAVSCAAWGPRAVIGRKASTAATTARVRIRVPPQRARRRCRAGTCVRSFVTTRCLRRCPPLPSGRCPCAASAAASSRYPTLHNPGRGKSRLFEGFLTASITAYGDQRPFAIQMASVLNHTTV
jgi:hypothetical protein